MSKKKEKVDLTDLETYYFYRDKFDKSLVSRLTHNQRLLLHPLLLKIISYRNKKAGFEIETLYDLREKTDKPIIFAITHIGKFDIEIASEIIKDHYYLLSGDFENMMGTVEEKFLGLNGVVYIREDDKEDRKLSKEKMIKTLKNGGNMMYFPEGTWNLTPNLPVLQCPYGIIEVAMRSGATIIPIGIEQYGKKFVAAVGQNFDVSQYTQDEKVEAISELRDRLAALKWDIWESVPDEEKTKMNEEWFNRHVEERLEEWPNMPLEQFLESAFKPKHIAHEKQVYSFLENMEINKNNCFLAKSKDDYVKKYVKK